MTILLGYTDKPTVRGGESIAFKVSAEPAQLYSAQLVRLINGDYFSEQADFKEIEIDSPLTGDYTGEHQPIYPGSCILVEDTPLFDTLDDITISLSFMATTPGAGQQQLIGRWDQSGQQGWSLHINAQGCLAFTATADGQQTIAIEQTLKPHQWYRAALRLSSRNKTVQLDCHPVGKTATHLLAIPDASAVGTVGDLPKALSTPLMMAAAYGGLDGSGKIIPVDCFNGRLERPVIYRSYLSDATLAQVVVGERPAAISAQLLADWDFSRAMQTTRIEDLSANKLQGTTHNMPMRAVKGSQPDIAIMEWPRAPQEYSAIHFHDDDLYDCGWPTSHTYTVPADLKSGIYALRLRQQQDGQQQQEEYLPFFVAAPKGQPQAKIALMIPTFTYQAYGNHQGFKQARLASDLSDEAYYQGRCYHGPKASYKPYDDAMDFKLGGSLYDLHNDGSPIHYSSWLRPLLNVRPKSLLLSLGVDLLFTAWLEHAGFDYDIITDHLVHAEGAPLLNQYNVVITGHHPEYTSTPQMDAIAAYLDQGGRLMYMGGNGFYFRIAVSATEPEVIEVRRRSGGEGTWRTQVGELNLQFSGETSGTWRDLDRPPQQLVGVGFIAQSVAMACTHYRVLPKVRDSRAAFILEGIDEEVIGDFGIFGNGAAGLEIDQASAYYGTPEHAVIIARSENHDSDMHVVFEEMICSNFRENYQDKAYADIVFFETPNGGAVFSVGSITWHGSLGYNGYNNAVATMTGNVLARFCDAEPFNSNFR